MSDCILRSEANRVVTLTLNRPEKLNALTVEMFVALRTHVDELATNRDVAVVVLRGAGRCFSAGHDLSDIAEGETPPTPYFQGETIERLANLPQPVITAVHGYCFTGGLELALAGDLIVAAESAKFADTHAKWALTPIWGLSQRLPRRVGLPKAREMMFTCRTVNAGEAAAIGLANEVVADVALDARLADLASQIAENSSFSHAANKRLLLESDGLPIGAGLALESYRTEGAGPDVYDRIERFTKRPK